MAFPDAMMFEKVWLQKHKYDQAENNYQLFLTNNLSGGLAEKHHPSAVEKPAATKQQQSKKSDVTQSPLINEISKAREAIKESLSGMTEETITDLKKENEELKCMVAKLTAQVKELELAAKGSGGKKVEEKKEEADDDFDLFGDDSDEEETEAEIKRKAELVAKYKEKKSKKAVVIAKSSVTLAVKPWDDETDMAELERLVRTIEMDGLVWGASKLVPLAYGIRALNIICVVEDDKVSTEELGEKIVEFDQFIQSVDTRAFNKI